MATNQTVTEEEVISWAAESLEHGKFDSYEIQLVGTSKKSDGYLGDIVFVSVAGESKGKKEELRLVVKHGKKNVHLKETMPLRLAFEREIYFYEVVFQAFKEFQIEKKVNNGFASVPKCYKTFLSDHMEVLVLENLSQRGYQLYDNKKPLNMEHAKLVLTEYGKLHALTFALKEQKSSEYKKIVSNYSRSVMKEVMLSSGLNNLMDKKCIVACEILKEANHLSLSEQFKNSIKTSASNELFELIDAREPQSVITHGDCWNNNFLYQYKEGIQRSPTQVALLDFQASGIQSPVFDLSYFLFTCCSTEELRNFDELINTYYTSFSNLLASLGSDPKKCFTFTDLKKHWKKYSLMGLLMSATFMPVFICDADEAPELGEIVEGKTVGDAFAMEFKNQAMYKERLIAVMTYYYQILNNFQ